MTTAYPLAWPGHIDRSRKIEKARLKTTLSAALRNVQDSLRLFGRDSGKSVSELIISSNYALGADNPKDPGVAVYFVWDGLTVCFPIDRYNKIEHNLQAVHHVIEAERTKLRHGTLQLVRASFTGFTALPPPRADAKRWWQVLELPNDQASAADVEVAYKRLARKAHPDTGGSHEAMQALNVARVEGLRR